MALLTSEAGGNISLGVDRV